MATVDDSAALEHYTDETWHSFALVPPELLEDDSVNEKDSIDGLMESVGGEEFDAFTKEVEQADWYNVEQKSSDGTDDFLPLDEELVKETENGGHDASMVYLFGLGFDEWRKSFGYSCSVPLEDIPLVELNNMLVKFMLQVKKKNGELYPAGSLSVLYRAIGRMIRKRQEKRIGETGVQEIKFNIIQNEIFKRSTYAFVFAARRSILKGVGVKISKAPAISFATELDLLSDVDHQITHSRGCQKRLCYYICSRFGVRGASELHSLLDCDFSLDSDQDGEYLHFVERASKNYQVTATRYDTSHFREPVFTHELDFVQTYKQYVRHLPEKKDEKKKDKPRSFFLTAIGLPATNVWYNQLRVGVKTIKSWIQQMESITNNAEICNRSGRVSAVTRMATAGVPAEVGMRITGHRSVQVYQKYDRNKDLQMKAAMSIISSPTNPDGSVKTYEYVLAKEIVKKRETEARSVLGVQDDNSALKQAVENIAEKVVAEKVVVHQVVGKENNDLFSGISDKALLQVKIPESSTLVKGNTLIGVSGFSFLGTVSNCIFLQCQDAKDASVLAAALRK